MPRPVQELEFDIHVQFEEISEGDDLDRYAGIFLLLQWIRAARNIAEPTDRPDPAHVAADELAGSPVACWPAD